MSNIADLPLDVLQDAHPCVGEFFSTLGLDAADSRLADLAGAGCLSHLPAGPRHFPRRSA